MGAKEKQLKQNEAAKVTSLADIGKLKVTTTAGKPKKLPTLPPSRLGEKKTNEETKAAIAKCVEGIHESVRLIAKELLNEEDFSYAKDDVHAEVTEIITVITDESWPEKAKEDMVEAYMNAAIEVFPANRTALTEIADSGKKLGAWRVVAENSKEFKDGRCVKLPLTVEETGYWKPTLLTPTWKNSREALGLLKKKVLQVAETKEAAREAELAQLRAGTTGTLTEVIGKGTGEATFFVPDEMVPARNGREPFTRYGGNVRVEVKSGKLFAKAAVGGCRSIVGKIMGAGVSIPTSTIGKERLELGRREPDSEKFKLYLALFGLISRGWKKEQAKAKAMAEVTELQAKATLSAEDKNSAKMFVVDGAVGTAALFLKYWKVPTKEGGTRNYGYVNFLAERREDGQMRVVETTARCADLFGPECREFTAPGEKFGGLPEPLGAMLRSLYGRLARAAARDTEGGEGDPASPKTPDGSGSDEDDAG